jgi:hypothetical protein
MPKSYSQFKHQDISGLGLTLYYDRVEILRSSLPVQPSDFLIQTLAINTEQALITEKAKSEFIIAPILYEIARKNENRISFYSGHNLDVDKDLGLKGFCDFLYSRSPKSTTIKEPIFCIAEAKNDNLEKGVPQCVAEMYAARLFNERKNKPLEVIYGCVTTGFQWQFLKLEGSDVFQDNTIYSLTDLPKILGILQFIVEQ